MLVGDTRVSTHDQSSRAGDTLGMWKLNRLGQSLHQCSDGTVFQSLDQPRQHLGNLLKRLTETAVHLGG